MAEFLLRRALAERGIGWHVRSSGLRAVAGRPMHPSTLAVLGERGIAVGDWVSTRTSAEQLRRADLVLTATARHRSQAITLAPDVLRRSFTIRQFARLADAADPLHDRRLPALVAAAAAARSRLQPVAAELEDVADPIGQPLRAFQRTAAELDDAVTRMLSPLR